MLIIVIFPRSSFICWGNPQAILYCRYVYMALTGAILLFNYWTRHDPLEFFIHCIVWPWNPPLSQFTSTRRYSRCMSAWDGSCNVEERHSWLYSKYRTRDCDKMLWQNTNVVGEYLNIILCAFVFVRSRTHLASHCECRRQTHTADEDRDTYSWMNQLRWKLGRNCWQGWMVQ